MPNQISDRPILIIIRGLPGSGKTHFAQELKKALMKQQIVVMLDPDATDYTSEEYKQHTAQLSKEGVDPKLHAYRFLRSQAYNAIAKQQIIIWNQPFSSIEIFHKMMDRLETHASEHNTTLLTMLVEVEIDPEIARSRIQQRKNAGGHGPSSDTFARFISDHKSFSGYGYKTISIRGDANVSESVKTVIKALMSTPSTH